MAGNHVDHQNLKVESPDTFRMSRNYQFQTRRIIKGNWNCRYRTVDCCCLFLEVDTGPARTGKVSTGELGNRNLKLWPNGCNLVISDNFPPQALMLFLLSPLCHVTAFCQPLAALLSVYNFLTIVRRNQRWNHILQAESVGASHDKEFNSWFFIAHSGLSS
jgi:hypothetical protein